MDKVRIRRERMAKPYCDMWKMAERLAARAKEKSIGWHWDCLAALVFAAFTVEGYLNHIGHVKCQDWDDLDRLPPLAKLRFLCRLLSIEYRPGDPAFQTVGQLFKFRNSVAHPHSEPVIREDVVSKDLYEKKLYDRPETDWERFVTMETLDRVLCDVPNLLCKLHDATRLRERMDFLFQEGGWSGCAGPANEPQA